VNGRGSVHPVSEPPDDLLGEGIVRKGGLPRKRDRSVALTNGSRSNHAVEGQGKGSLLLVARRAHFGKKNEPLSAIEGEDVNNLLRNKDC